MAQQTDGNPVRATTTDEKSEKSDDLHMHLMKDEEVEREDPEASVDESQPYLDDVKDISPQHSPDLPGCDDLDNHDLEDTSESVSETLMAAKSKEVETLQKQIGEETRVGQLSVEISSEERNTDLNVNEDIDFDDLWDHVRACKIQITKTDFGDVFDGVSGADPPGWATGRQAATIVEILRRRAA